MDGLQHLLHGLLGIILRLVNAQRENTGRKAVGKAVFQISVGQIGKLAAQSAVVQAAQRQTGKAEAANQQQCHTFTPFGLHLRAVNALPDQQGDGGHRRNCRQNGLPWGQIGGQRRPNAVQQQKVDHRQRCGAEKQRDTVDHAHGQPEHRHQTADKGLPPEQQRQAQGQQNGPHAKEKAGGIVSQQQKAAQCTVAMEGFQQIFQQKSQQHQLQALFLLQKGKKASSGLHSYLL